MSTVRVRVSHAAVAFDGRLALDDVSLDAAPGAVTAIVGGDGAGKTTLLRLLVGRVPLASGTVEVPDLASVGYLPASVGCWAGLTVQQNIDFVGGSYGMPSDRLARRADELLAAAGLAAFRDRPAGQLSGGMRRKLGVAMAMVHDPALLVLDEPTAGLDPEQRLRFRELVSQAGEGRAVVLSTHQTEDVAALCQDVVVLHEGRVRFQGAPADLASVANGRVWFAAQRDPAAAIAWRTGEGLHRHLGDAPSGADLVEPTLEDGYLLLIGRRIEVAA